MKKIFVLTAALMLVATASFAAPTATGTLTLANDGLTLYGSADTTTGNDLSLGKFSTGVSCGWRTLETGYAIMTQHASGTKAYGSSYDSTAIFQTTGAVDPGVLAYNTGNLTATDTTDFTVGNGWAPM